MKPLRAMIFLFCVSSTLLLAGCGGQSTVTIGGLVIGLNSGASVTLVNNGADPITVSSDSEFKFDASVSNGGAYNVTVATQPAGESCIVTSGAGNANNGNVFNVNVTCNPTIGVAGTVTGLASGASITLVNMPLGGSTESLVVSNNTGVTGNIPFLFLTPLPLGGNYSVSVSVPPPGEACFPSGNSGVYSVLGTVVNITVQCN